MPNEVQSTPSNAPWGVTDGDDIQSYDDDIVDVDVVDVTHPEQGELCGCVALVVGAVALALPRRLPGPGGGQSVIPDNPETRDEVKFVKIGILTGSLNYLLISPNNLTYIRVGLEIPIHSLLKDCFNFQACSLNIPSSVDIKVRFNLMKLLKC